MKKVLIIGPINNAHINRLVSNIKRHDINNVLAIDGFNTDLYSNKNNILLNHTYQIKRHFFSLFYHIHVIKDICIKIDILLSFIKIKDKYDICNIHFPNINTTTLRSFLRKKSNKIIISPWGSDVLRIDKNIYQKIKDLYTDADIITVPPIKFREEVQRIFNVPSYKIVNLGFGSEIIDILLKTEIQISYAKERLGIKDKYIITCGYNASPAQNHISIINALVNLKELLPNNTLLLFPMTYAKQEEYISNIKHVLERSGFQYQIYDEYLSNETIADIRIATDLFLHIQDTDAYSATLQEFLYTNTIVFNGNWTRYPNLEKNGIPYFIINDKSNIESSIRNFLINKTELFISNDCKKEIEKLSWVNKGNEWFNYLTNNE